VKLPKVLIFTTIYQGKDYALKEFLEHANKINYPNYQHIFVDNSPTLDYVAKLQGMGLDAYHVERGNNTREAIARACNFARRIAIDEGYDYFMSLESDIMCTPTVVQDLMKHGKDVVTALYHIGDDGLRVPCITIAKWNENLGAFGTRLLAQDEFSEYTNSGLKAVQAGGFGCCLMYKRGFLEFPFTYDPRFNGHPDIYYFNELFKKKIPVFVDTDVVLEHDNRPWQDIEDR